MIVDTCIQCETGTCP